jgi:hypothetical protein
MRHGKSVSQTDPSKTDGTENQESGVEETVSDSFQLPVGIALADFAAKAGFLGPLLLEIMPGRGRSAEEEK